MYEKLVRQSPKRFRRVLQLTLVVAVSLGVKRALPPAKTSDRKDRSRRKKVTWDIYVARPLQLQNNEEPV